MTPPRPLSPKEVETLLLELAPSNYYGYAARAAVRNKLIALLMLEAGCRTREVTRLWVQHAYWQGQPREQLEIPDTIAKYHIGGLIPIPPRLRACLIEYLPLWHPPDRHNPTNYLIYHTTGADPLSCRQIHRILSTAAASAIPGHFHPHMLRHTFADRLRQVTDVATAMRLLRHRHLSSTQVYFHSSDREMATAMSRAFPQP